MKQMACRAIKSEEIQITELPKEVILMVNLPNCPRGESFVLAIDESCYYNPLTEDDKIVNIEPHMKQHIKQYMFLPNEVISNHDFFFHGNLEQWVQYEKRIHFPKSKIYGGPISRNRQTFLNE